MDLDPDTLDAIKSDAYAELGLELGWGDDDDGTRDLKHDIVNAIVPFVARAVARATADAIADKINEAMLVFGESNEGDYYNHGLHDAATIARSFGRTPETDNRMSAIVQEIASFEVYPKGLGDMDRMTWAVRVENRGKDRWAVTNMGRCLDVDGYWDHEPQPSSRDDEWLAQHRFDQGEALRLAHLHAPHVTWNGRTAASLAMSVSR